MAVYVNKVRDWSRLLFGRTAPPPPSFSLTADTQDELHAFAARLGIRRDPGSPVGPQRELVTRHYTLTEGQRDRRRTRSSGTYGPRSGQDGTPAGRRAGGGPALNSNCQLGEMTDRYPCPGCGYPARDELPGSVVR